MSLPSRFDCAETFRRLADYLDRELADSEIEKVEEHLKICEVCAAEYRFEETLLRNLRLKAQTPLVPEKLKQGVLRILQQAKSG